MTHTTMHTMRMIKIIQGFNLTVQLLIRFFRIRQIVEKNGSTMREYISYSQTSRKPMIQLEGKYCTILSLRLG
jgi:hypothetical protein